MKLLKRNPRGQALVIVTLLLVVFFGLASLALDIGRAYGVKAKLHAAVDAASYATAKAMAQGSSDSGATEVAQAYFKANYPAEYLGATPSYPPSITFGNVSGGRTVEVSATAMMATFFAGVLDPQWQGKCLAIAATSTSKMPFVNMTAVYFVN